MPTASEPEEARTAPARAENPAQSSWTLRPPRRFSGGITKAISVASRVKFASRFGPKTHSRHGGLEPTRAKKRTDLLLAQEKANFRINPSLSCVPCKKMRTWLVQILRARPSKKKANFIPCAQTWGGGMGVRGLNRFFATQFTKSSRARLRRDDLHEAVNQLM